MADGQKLDLNASSLIDLKAELFRKQEEFRQLKLQNNADLVKGRKVEKHGKPDIWSKKNTGVSQRSQNDIQQTEEEEDILEKSRRALEAKSKIYDKIASTSDIPEDDGSEGYLVDFQKKALDRIVEERRKEPESDTQERDADLSDRDLGRVSDEDINGELPPLSFEPDEEWVDYVDTFGRSRRCMKKDFPQLEKQERTLGKGYSHEGLKLKADAPTLLSADMRRELLRQKWEQEMEQTQNGPVHYSNVQFDEIRTHGVGYYQFSKDSTLREEEMTSLNKLREQTLEGRLRSERIKEKRKAALDARLAKVKQRRKMKDGSLPEESSMEEKADAATVTEDKTTLKPDPEPLVRDDSWRRTAPVREWDKGKEKMPEWNEKRYMEDRRNEREEEFAPPQFYYDSQSKTGLSASHPVKKIGDQRSTANLGDRKAMSSVITLDERSTMPMLAQIRSNAAASEVDGIIAKDLSVHDSANLDLSAIPLPLKDFANSLSDAESISSRNAPVMQDRFCEVSQSLPCLVAESNTATCHMQSSSLGSAICNFSVPPPGWNLTHPPVGGGIPVPSHATDLPIAEVFETHSSLPVAISHFLYPSQQGVLTPQSQQQHQQFHHESGSNHTISTQPLLARSISYKAGIVDKRFMQNKEASEADLLGLNFSESEDALAQVKPVSYKPGLFSATSDVSSECERNANRSINYAEGVHDGAESNPVKGETVSLSENSSKGQKPATVQTESVIFGVPEFLQPASGVEAKVYQPGSFMAAKVAAAERAEEAYEAARQKTSYCSAPVLYNKLSSTTCDKTDDGK